MRKIMYRILDSRREILQLLLGIAVFFIPRILDSRREILQLLLFIAAFFIPGILDLKVIISSIVREQGVSFDKLKYFYLNLFDVLGLVLCVLYFVKIRKCNKKKIFNKGDIYHRHSYFWFFFCSKILGYEQCNLVLVPIYLQFKLVIRDTFDKYIVDGNFLPKEDNRNISVVTIKDNIDSESNDLNEVNLILEDTYEISLKQIPKNKQSIKTIKVSRNCKDKTRKYNDFYVDKVISVVRNFPNGTIINIFATTNTKHNFEIAKRCFSLGGRGNISKIYVFQQELDKNRVFKKQYKI